MISANVLRVVAYSPSNQVFSGNDGNIISLTFDVFGTGGWYPINLSEVIMTDLSGINILSASYNGGLEVAAPDIHCQSSVAFGDVSVLETASRYLRIHNYGSDKLIIDQLLSSNASFYTNQTLPLEVLQGHYFDLQIYFNNPTKGSYSGNLNIFSNDPDENPFVVTLTARAYAPNFMVVADTEAPISGIATIDVHINNHETFTAFDFELHYPNEIMTFQGEASHTHLTGRATDHLLNAGITQPGVLRVFAFSQQQQNFTGSNGSVVRLGFSMHAQQSGATYPLLLANPVMAAPGGQNILYGTENGTLTTVEGSQPVPQILEIRNEEVYNFQQHCFAAQQSILVAGGGTLFTVHSGGSANLVAGQNIRFMPGTHIHSGGYMHAYITTTGTYCPDKQLSDTSTNDGLTAVQNAPVSDDEFPFFNVFPNPGTGLFTLEILPENGTHESPLFGDSAQSILVEVYNMQGSRIISHSLNGVTLHTFDISQQLPGIFIIRLIHGDQTFTQKLIKR
jgi:hypothetical protein